MRDSLHQFFEWAKGFVSGLGPAWVSLPARWLLVSLLIAGVTGGIRMAGNKSKAVPAACVVVVCLTAFGLPLPNVHHSPTLSLWIFVLGFFCMAVVPWSISWLILPKKWQWVTVAGIWYALEIVSVIANFGNGK